MKAWKIVCICLAIVVAFAAGIFVGVNYKTISDDDNDTTVKRKGYESCSSIYINVAIKPSGLIPSTSYPDITATKALEETLAIILQSADIREEIDKEFPDTDYELALESVGETTAYKITVTGKDPENLQDICNLATNLLCRRACEIVDGISCKVIDSASAPVRRKQ